jgi:hypothetical protein
MMESREGFKAKDSAEDLFDLSQVDALGVGTNWHVIVPGSLTFALDSEETWWVTATLEPNLAVGDTPTHSVWFPFYEVSGYRVIDASATE